MAINTVNTPTLVNRLIPLETLDKLTVAAAKLDALLACTYGESGESFRNMNGDIQDVFLWTCSDLSREIKTLAGQI